MRRARYGRDNAAWPVVLSAVLLSGAVAAAVSAAAIRFGEDRPLRVASVRLGEIATGYATQAAKTGESPYAARAWAAALESALATVAERHGAVLLPARAVAAGAPDVTPEVESVLAALLGRRRPAESDARAGETP